MKYAKKCSIVLLRIKARKLMVLSSELTKVYKDYWKFFTEWCLPTYLKLPPKANYWV